ncbi:MAG: response regulator [Dissulfurispiraceae bacterium]
MILIVDDNPIDIELTMIALEAIGREIDVCSALDGKSALAKLMNGVEVPALILLDLKMPGMSGIEVLREIRANERFRKIPIVVVTSSALESDKVEAIAAGASAYIQKPLALHQFSKDLESILRRWLPNALDTLLKVPVSISVTIQKLTSHLQNHHFCDLHSTVHFLVQHE